MKEIRNKVPEENPDFLIVGEHVDYPIQGTVHFMSLSDREMADLRREFNSTFD